MNLVLWALVTLAGAAGWGVLALHRGETVSAAWLVLAAVGTYLVAYRFYSRFLADRVFGLDNSRATPAERLANGRDYVPTTRWVLFGHHFAAIAGAGPLVGPVLAAQFGYLPGTLWIVFGVVLGGAVQDFVILFGSMRRDGKSLGQMAKEEIGPFTGYLAMAAVLAIMIILLAVLALVVVNALKDSPWGVFTIICTIPIAVMMGFWMKVWRPGRTLEASLAGVVLLLAALVAGRWVAESATLAPYFTWSATTIAYAVIGYGFVASVLPVWMLLCPRDYLSTFMKIGTILLLAVGIMVVLPPLRMPALTRFVDGTGPVFAGKLFPFAFITIACGAISGFHALVASGTTPKMLRLESDARLIGYGGMLMESFVAVMALCAASVLEPGVYFAINAPAAALGPSLASAAEAVRGWGFAVTPAQLQALAAQMGEASLVSRAGGAPSLAVGMATIFAGAFGQGLTALWYHFAIMFEALFILTTVDTGTRVGRFMLQDFAGHAWAPLGRTSWYPGAMLASALVVAGWGYFLVQGVLDPLGGINSLWPLFGISNQLLAAVALCVGSTLLIKAGKARYAWVTLLPLSWLLVVTLTAGWQKLFAADPRLGFFSHAAQTLEQVASGALDPAKGARIVFNDRLDAAVTITFMAVTVLVVLSSVREWIVVLRPGVRWRRRRLRAELRRLVAALRRVAGMPDYAAYVAHLRRCHPDRAVPTEREFFAEYVAARYGDGPTPLLLTVLALCAFAFLAMFVDAIAGGGGLIQLPALLILLPGVPVATVLGTAKISSVASTSSALLRYHGSVPFRWRATLWSAGAAFLCAILGARAVSRLPQYAIRPAILVLLVLVAAYTIARPSFGAIHAPRLTPARERWAAAAIGAVLGFYDGFFGPGMGSFLIFGFVGVLGFDFLAASAAGKVVNLGSGLAAAIYFSVTGHVLWQVALPMAAAGAVGSFVGAHTAVRRGSGFVRPLFLVVVAGVICKFGWDTVMGR